MRRCIISSARRILSDVLDEIIRYARSHFAHPCMLSSMEFSWPKEVSCVLREYTLKVHYIRARGCSWGWWWVGGRGFCAGICVYCSTHSRTLEPYCALITLPLCGARRCETPPHALLKMQFSFWRNYAAFHRTKNKPLHVFTTGMGSAYCIMSNAGVTSQLVSLSSMNVFWNASKVRKQIDCYMPLAAVIILLFVSEMVRVGR
jgi:hypothetical protein